MNDDREIGIVPIHEVFYLESMLLVTSSALDAGDRIEWALAEGAKHDPASPEWQEFTYAIIHAVHTLAVQAGGLARYFWPSRTRTIHSRRAERLRTAFNVDELSALHNKNLRNQLEHFDEKLDVFLSTIDARNVRMAYVGPCEQKATIRPSHFRAYYTDSGVLEVLGLRMEMQPLLDEVRLIHNVIVRCLENGGRLPSA